MRDLTGRVCVVTGAAGGIGLAMAEQFAAEGMKVVLGDVERGPLEAAAARLQAAGHDAIAVECDVSAAAAVDALAALCVERFGGVHVLCANAGVFGSLRPLWERDATDWSWQFGVNVLGVGNCIRSFVPIMLRLDTEANVVITASEASYNVRPFTGVYNATKHALIAIAETLALELAIAGSKIHVSALCPGGVNTRILEAERNRPGGAVAEPSGSDYANRMASAYRLRQPRGMSPAEVAGQVVNAVREDRFFIFTHPELKEPMRRRFEDAMAERNPEPDAAFMARFGQAAVE